MKRPFTILNLSDLHINADNSDDERQALVGLPGQLRVYIDKIKGEQIENIKWEPNYIAIPGDIIYGKTNNPNKRNASYAKAVKILDKFYAEFSTLLKRKEENGEEKNVTVITVPGNHDRETVSVRPITKLLFKITKKKPHIKRYKQLKENLLLFCGGGNNREVEEKFVNFHQEDFKLYANFSKQFISEEDDYFDWIGATPLKYTSGLRVFKEHKVCFVCVNTEWLYTRGWIEPKQEFHLVTPAVIKITDKLKTPEYVDYTVITLMHRKPDDLPWKEKNDTDIMTHNALKEIERHSDIILSGHEHAMGTMRPDKIKNQIQHFKLGSQGAHPDGNGRFPYSVSLIHVNPINLTVELLTGNYDGSWEFVLEGTFDLRNKYASLDEQKSAKICTPNEPVCLMARSADKDEVMRVLKDYYSGCNGKWNLMPVRADDFDLHRATPIEPTLLVLYALSDDQCNLNEMKKLYRDFNAREEIHKQKTLGVLITDYVIIKTPQDQRH